MRPYFADLPKTALGAAYWLFAVYLLLPLALMTAMSFKDASFVAFPITDWTLNWYAQVLQDKQFIEASLYSVGIALATTAAMPIHHAARIVTGPRSPKLRPNSGRSRRAAGRPCADPA